jgi:hypothetical protein
LKQIQVLLIALFFIVSQVFLSPLSFAGTITSTGTNSWYARTTLGQSFTMPLGESGTLTSITVPGVRGRAPSNIACVQAKVYTNSSKATLIQTSLNTICDTDSSGTESTGIAASGSFNFGDVNLLTAGTQYFFELSPTSGATAIWATQSYAVPNGGYADGQLFVDGAFQANFDLAFTLIYSSLDSTAPTFTSSSSFNFAENTSVATAAATIKISESATVTISSGADAALFNISTSDSVTALIKFKVSPNYEAPTDVGANNVYEITLTATDSASNAGTQSITITVTDVVDTSSFNSLSLSGAATYRQIVSITASVTVASKVTFRAANIIISGCKNKVATGSGSSYSVTCSWKPSKRGAVVITATSTPTAGGITGATATPVSVNVVNRSGVR